MGQFITFGWNVSRVKNKKMKKSTIADGTTSARTKASKRTNAEDSSFSPTGAKPIVSRSPGEQLINVCKDKRVAFLENGHFLDDLSEIIGEYLSANNIDFLSICDVEKQGLETVLRQCRDKDIIIFQTTWTYPVSTQLKEAFMSIRNPEFKKTFIEIYVSEPTFSKLPEGVIHDIYALDIYEKEVSDWVFLKLDKVVPFWELKG